LTSPNILTLPPPPPDHRIAYGPDPNQFGELRLPSTPGPHAVLVAIHGGFWRAAYDLGYLGHLCADLTARGYATWSLEYRRLGQPGGGWPATFLDAAAGLDHLRPIAAEHALDLGRVATIGHSAGGHLALWLAARHRLPADSPFHGRTPDPLPIRAAVSLAGVVSLRRASELRLSNAVVHDLLGGTPANQPARYAAASPYELLPLGLPQLLVHGTADAPVPHELSAAYAARARALGDDVRFLSFPDVDHFAVVDPRSTVWPGIVNEIARVVPLS
jgi:acetyl esterase/lipase